VVAVAGRRKSALARAGQKIMSRRAKNNLTFSDLKRKITELSFNAAMYHRQQENAVLSL